MSYSYQFKLSGGVTEKPKTYAFSRNWIEQEYNSTHQDNFDQDAAWRIACSIGKSVARPREERRPVSVVLYVDSRRVREFHDLYSR